MPRNLTPDDLLTLRLPGDPQLSPDGSRLAYVVQTIDKEANEYRNRLYLMDAHPGARPVPFTAGPKSDRQPRWSPDGSQIAFISDRSGKNQLWVIAATGGEARQVTRFKDGISGPPVWSPDGTRIALTAQVGPEGPGREGDKRDETDLYKKYTKGVRRITRIWYKEDGTGFLDAEKRDQIFYVPLDGEEPEPVQVTRGHWNHSAPDWSPDGRAMAFAANRRADDDYTPFLIDIWVQSLEQPEAEPVCLTDGTLWAGSPAWSPDGKHIAFKGTHWGRHAMYSQTRLFVVGRDGSDLRELAPGWDRPFDREAILDTPGPVGGRLSWTPDGLAVIHMGSDAGRQQVYAVDLEADAVTQLTAGDHCLTGWSFDRHCRKFVVAATRPDLPGDLFLVEGPDLLPLTHENEAFLAEVALAPALHFRFDVATGDPCGETDGWVVRPPGLADSARSPLVLQVHGGPMAMYGWSFFLEAQCLAAAGYAVVYTNPRGSQGYGQDFCACIRSDWGNLDYQDVMAGLDAALAQFLWLDPERTGIAGGSYGGFMVNWAIGQSNRFKAAVTMRSCVNEGSMVGTSDFGFVDMESYPALPWEDLSFYQRVSPLTHVANIRTPLLIEHQEQDLRCPMEQAEQLYTALKMLKRPVEFVRYPDSSHGMSRTGKPWLRVHRLRTILEWFGRYIPQ